jgi:hypothetical protein
MKLVRRRFFHLAAGAAALPAVSRRASAQTYPRGPVHLIVGFPAGGTNDVHARLIAEWLARRLGRAFLVENRPGAAGNIALEGVVRAAPDGYTLSVCGSTELRNEMLYKDLKFSFLRDTAPALSRRRAGHHRPLEPAGAGLLRQHRGGDGAHQSRQIACTGGDQRSARTRIARCSSHRRFCARL